MKKKILFFILFLFLVFSINFHFTSQKKILDDRLFVPNVAYAFGGIHDPGKTLGDEIRDTSENTENAENQAKDGQQKEKVTVNEYVEVIENIDGGSFLERALAEVLANIIGGIMVLLSGISDFKTLDAIVFNAGSTADRFLPLSAEDWSKIYTWYGIVASIAGSILFISIMTVFFKFIKATNNPHYRKDAISALKRLFLSAIVISTAPIMIQLFLYVNNCMVEAFYSALSNGKSLQDTFKATTIISSLDLSSPLVGVLILALFAYLTIKVNIIFIIRNFNLIVYMLFTPFASNLWVIDENINGAKVWLGEILSNIFMQTAYAFMFSVYLSFMDGKSWLTQIIWGNLTGQTHEINFNLKPPCFLIKYNKNKGGFKI